MTITSIHERFEVVQFEGITYHKYTLDGYKVLVRDIDRNQSYNNIHYDDIKPSFFHVPKTGGTSIESAFIGTGVCVGQFAFPNSIWLKQYSRFTKRCQGFRNYTTVRDEDPSFKQCSLFHVPPKQFVPKSITVIREPFQRYECKLLKENDIKHFHLE